MKLSWNVSYIQVKRLLKLINIISNVCKTGTDKIPANELYKSKGQVNNKGIICSEIPHTQIPHYVATSQLNCHKIHIPGFHKTRDNRTKNLRTDSSNKVNISGLKWYSNDGKRHTNTYEKSHLEWVKNSKLFHKRDAGISNLRK